MTPDRPSRLLIVLGAIVAVTFVLFAVWARFPVPYRDDWDWLASTLAGPLDLARLFQPHNEHLIPLARLLYAWQYRLEGAAGQLTFWIALASQAGIVALILREVYVRWEDAASTTRLALAGISLALLCFAWQLQSVVFVAAILFPVVQLAAVLGVAAAVRAGDAEGWRRTCWLGASLIASVAAVLTTTNGLALPVSLALVAVAMRESRWVVTLHLATAVLGGVAFYLLVLARMTGPGVALSAESSGAVLSYFAAFFAPFVTYFDNLAGVAVGAVLVVPGLALVVRVLANGRRVTRLDRFVVGLMLFAFGTAILAALGRASFGIDQAAQSRYATYTQVYWAALLLGLVSLLDRGRRATRMAPALQWCSVIAMSALLVVHIASGLVWLAKTDHIAAAGLTVRADVPDEAWLTVLHPYTSVVWQVQEQLRADPGRGLVDPWIGRRLPVDGSMGSCDATLTLVRVDNPRGQTWRVSGTFEHTSTRALIVDGDDGVVGLVERAPLVESPEAPRAVFVAALRQEITHWTGGDTRWFGLARATRSPYRFVALGELGEPVCAVVIVP